MIRKNKKFKSLMMFIYYLIRPVLPRYVQIILRKTLIKLQKETFRNIWPIKESAAKPPDGWIGWPEEKQFAVILTHDVETEEGLKKCIKLAELEKKMGFRSVFNFVPKRYNVPAEIINYLKDNGFEVGVHGLYHDGILYKNIKIFRKRAVEINKYLAEWNSVGFRAPSMHHNLQWHKHLNIEYDSSTFDTDPFEPQSDSVNTIFPFIIKFENDREYLELPYSLPQDFLLFVLMKEQTIDIWKQKLDWISDMGGMALLITHPDYMNFGDEELKVDQYSYKRYEEFLKYIKTYYENKYYHSLPREIPKLNIWKPLQNNHSKKICMLAYTFYESDNRVKRYAEALKERGDNVDVIALNQGKQLYYEKLNGINVFHIQTRKVTEKLRIEYLFKLLLFFINSFFFITKKVIFNNRYDLIHVHSVPDFEVFATLFAKLTNTKIILDIHDIVPEFYVSKFNTTKNSIIFKILLLLEKLSIAYSNHVIIANHIWYNRLISRSVKSEKCSVFLNYPDNSIFNNKLKSSVKNSVFTMIYPGTLSYHQGLDIAVKAISQIIDKVPKFEFHIYGIGSEKRKLEKLIKELELTDIVIFKDLESLNKIALKMANADLGIVPKRKDSFGNEAFSTKIFEFMALGVPVIAADTDIDKLYFDDTVLKFFKSGDEEDLANCMITLINDENERKKLVTNAYKLMEKYNWEEHQLRYFEIVDRLCSPQT